MEDSRPIPPARMSGVRRHAYEDAELIDPLTLRLPRVDPNRRNGSRAADSTQVPAPALPGVPPQVYSLSNPPPELPKPVIDATYVPGPPTMYPPGTGPARPEPPTDRRSVRWAGGDPTSGDGFHHRSASADRGQLALPAGEASPPTSSYGASSYGAGSYDGTSSYGTSSHGAGSHGTGSWSGTASTFWPTSSPGTEGGSGHHGEPGPARDTDSGPTWSERAWTDGSAWLNLPAHGSGSTGRSGQSTQTGASGQLEARSQTWSSGRSDTASGNADSSRYIESSRPSVIPTPRAEPSRPTWRVEPETSQWRSGRYTVEPRQPAALSSTEYHQPTVDCDTERLYDAEDLYPRSKRGNQHGARSDEPTGRFAALPSGTASVVPQQQRRSRAASGYPSEPDSGYLADGRPDVEPNWADHPRRSAARRSEPRRADVLPDLDDQSDEVEVEEVPVSDGTCKGAMVSSVVWCLLPVFLYVGWGLALASGSKDGCIDSSGQPCASARVVAWHDLLSVAPYIAMAIGLSCAMAMVLWRVTTGWRSTTVGFAASVVGAGVMTVLWSTLNATS